MRNESLKIFVYNRKYGTTNVINHPIRTKNIANRTVINGSSMGKYSKVVAAIYFQIYYFLNTN